ncbi:MAG: hypothetical protein WDN49_07115 [Acetobacteraceae bacterium]
MDTAGRQRDFRGSRRCGRRRGACSKNCRIWVEFRLAVHPCQPDNFALSLHNTASREGRILDEHLATVCYLRDGKIAAIETYLSDVEAMNAFFV